MPVEAEVRTKLAQQFNLPPPLVLALEGKQPPPGLLASFGIDPKDAQKNPAVGLTLLAHAVSKAFVEHGSLESALSQVFAGNPHAHESPTSPVAGTVGMILADAATKISHGWDTFQPQDAAAFGKVARQFSGYLQQSRGLGGIVTDDSLRFWDQTVARIAPPPKAPAPMAAGTGAVPGAPVPKGPTPAEVERFAGEMKGLGIDVGHFMEHFATYSAMRYKLLSSPTKLSDYAQVNGMAAHEMLDHVRKQPHPTYPHVTAGAYADAHAMASLHSYQHTRKSPEPTDVAAFAASGARHTEVAAHYQGQAGA